MHFAKFSIANNEFTGEKYVASFFDCVAFGELGETIYRKLKQGSAVFITGRLQQYRWTDASGGKHSKFSIVVKECTEVTGVLEAVELASAGITEDEDIHVHP